MQMKKKIGLVVLTFTLILTILNFAPQVDTITDLPNIAIQNEVALSDTISPAPPSMIAYWELNENGGTTITDSIVPYVTGHTAGNPLWYPGVAQSGLQLSENQYIDFGRPSYLYLPEVLTIEAWVNLPDTRGLHTIIMNAYNPTNIQYHFGIRDGQLYFDRQAGAPGNEVTSMASITPGNWHHVVVVMNWGLRRVWFYLDGVDDEIYPYTDGYTGPSGEVTIGADRATGAPSFLDGMIDEVAIYNDMLDQAIIQEHYQKGLHGLGYLDELPVNEAPVAIDDSYTMVQYDTLTVSAPGVLANDFDNDGDFLETELVSFPTYGTLTLDTDGGFVYEPLFDFSGIDSFEYRAFDGVDYSGTATVMITVEELNTPPVSVDDEYFVDEDGYLSVTSPGILENDTDYQYDVLTAEVINWPTYGDLYPAPDGGFDYIPYHDWFGSDTFTYHAFDGHVYGNEATVTITVNPVNDAPFASDDAYSGFEDAPIVESTLLTNDLDLEGDPLEIILVSGTAHGTLDIYPDGSFSYLPNLDWFGLDSFTYQAYDGELYSNEATVTLTIESVNDIPIIVDDVFTGYEDDVSSGNVLLNDYDVEWDECEVFLVTGPSHGVLELDPDTGFFTYQPNLDWFGVDTFTYNVYDGHMFSDVATVTLTITGLNDAPVAYSITFIGNEDVTLYATLPIATDVDGDVLVYELVGGPSHGTIVLDAGGTFGYSPTSNWFGIDTFTYRAFDGTDYSNIAVVTFEIIEDDDTTGPEITITFVGAATDSSPGMWTVVVVDPESGVDSVVVEIDGVLVGTFAGDYLVPNTLGVHTINVTATNADCNNGPYDQESSTLAHSVTIVDDDVTAPDISITYTGDMTNTNPGYWTVSVSDPESGVYSILVEIDGITVGTLDGDYPVPSTTGFHTITITAVNSDLDRPTDQESISHSGVVFIEPTIGDSEIIYLGNISGVYSDPVFLEVQLLDAITQLPLAGKMIQFTLGTQSAVAVTDAEGLASVTIILDQEAGVYTLIAAFAGDVEYIGSFSSTEFLIYKESAIVLYSGVTIAEVTDESFTLLASVFDDTDGYWGNLSNTYLTFSVFLSSDPLTPIYTSSPVKVQMTDIAGIGIATVDISSLPVGEYLMVASLLPEHNRFYCSPDTEAVTVIVYEPERAHVHGAGKIIDADGNRGFFVFKAKYTCDGSLKGFLIYTYIVGDWVYLVRSCDITGFATDGTYGFFETNGTISGYNFETHEKVCSDERYRIRVDVFDNRKTSEKDVFQIRVFDSLGQTEYEAGFDPFGYLLRGCIVVRHGHRHGAKT